MNVVIVVATHSTALMIALSLGSAVQCVPFIKVHVTPTAAFLCMPGRYAKRDACLFTVVTHLP
jgi:hypothetical protein